MKNLIKCQASSHMAFYKMILQFIGINKQQRYQRMTKDPCQAVYFSSVKNLKESFPLRYTLPAYHI